VNPSHGRFTLRELLVSFASGRHVPNCYRIRLGLIGAAYLAGTVEILFNTLAFEFSWYLISWKMPRIRKSKSKEPK
jgi:hypothetical protein